MPRFIIEARNVLYQRIGLVENYTSFEAIIRHNAVGSWSLTIPGGTPEVGYLQPNNGIIVRIDGQDEIAFSGPVTKVSRNWDETDQGAGSVTVSGVTDEQLIFDRVTYPIPENDLDNQTDDRNIVISSAGTLMEYLVDRNCGPSARPERIYSELDISFNPTLGGPASVSTRFEVLGEKVAEIANSQGLGFRVKQGLNERLLFETFQPQDKTDLTFGRQYGNLQAYSYDIEAPTATRVIFACQGEGKDRYFQSSDFVDGAGARWDDRDPRITYTNFTQPTDVDAYRSTITWIDWFTGEMEFTFTGTGFRIYGEHEDTPAWQNWMKIDNNPREVAWMSVPPDIPQSLLYERNGLPRGEHTILIESIYGLGVDYIVILDEREQEWERNSERFYDRRDIPVSWNAAHTELIDPSTGGPADPGVYGPILDQAALEAWDENGSKGSLSMTPIDTEVIKYGRDYKVGDIVTVDIDGTQFTDVLREVRLSDGDDGPRITPTIGDSQASSTPTLYRTVRRLWSKVRKLEAQ